jgi:hypothetical protein
MNLGSPGHTEASAERGIPAIRPGPRPTSAQPESPGSSLRVQPLPATPLDIVGDVHGELEALTELLALAGYDPDGAHPEGRRLVFVGDLVDRGPDSPGVVALVRRLIAAGRAQAVLGNHELNLLRGQRKPGNDWFWGEDAAHDLRYRPFACAAAAQREELLAFFDGLPLMLTRPDLRVVHAAWHGPSVARLLDEPGPAPVGQLAHFRQWEVRAEAVLAGEGWVARARAEKAAWRHRLHDATVEMPMLDAVGQLDEARQMLNPLRVLTSGVERRADAPFHAGGQWRFVQRVPWWDDYADEVPVVVGHYWRQHLPLERAALGKGDADLFEGIAPTAWLGPRGRVFCIDFSVGGRYQERRAGQLGARTRLGMLRWPERSLLFDRGEVLATG